MQTSAFCAVTLAVALVTPAGSSQDSGVVTGSFPPGAPYVPPEEQAPPRLSRAHVQTVALSEGQGTVEVRSSGRSEMVLWMIPLSRAAKIDRRVKPGLSYRLRAPSSRLLARPSATVGPMPSTTAPLIRRVFEPMDVGIDLPGMHEAIQVRVPETGVHRLEIQAEGAADAAIVVAAEPDSPLTLTTWATPLSRRPGEPVVLSARVLDGERPVIGARVMARLAPSDKASGDLVELVDDGRHGDGASRDGLYATSVAPGDLPGFWSVRFDAEGKSSQGIPFLRTSCSGFMNERDSARFVPASLRAHVEQGTRRSLKFTAVARFRDAGAYRLDVIVAGTSAPDGRRRGVAWAERTLKVSAGQASLTLDIPISTERPKPAFVDVRLLDLSSMGLADRVTLEVDSRP